MPIFKYLAFVIESGYIRYLVIVYINGISEKPTEIYFISFFQYPEIAYDVSMTCVA